MHIEKLSKNQDIQSALIHASEGRFYSWKRSYVVQTDHDVHTVVLNLFERINKAVIEFFGGDYFRRCFNHRSVRLITSLPVPKHLLQVIDSTPKFSNYCFESEPATSLTSLSHRPANLFFEALLGKDKTTMPGSSHLFSFVEGNQKVRQSILNLKDDAIIAFNGDRQVKVYSPHQGFLGERDLKSYLGTATFRISGRELKEQLESQQVHLSPLLPKKFYLALKEAMGKDKIVELPGHERDMYTMEKFAQTYPHVKDFIQKVKDHPAHYGLTPKSFNSLMELTLYQIGSMVVKTENYHCFVGKGLQLREREPNSRDAIMLISACGIRGFHTQENSQVKGNQNHERDREIMKHSFKCALDAAKDGFALFPAVGMGVWAGDPDVYWRAFFDAVIASDNQLEAIFVNPGHRETSQGKYKGRDGDEFDEILAEYGAHPKLAKIINLYSRGTDLLLLAQNLKNQFPAKNTALFNASDPDVTLGNHVGEYVNNLCHPNTTEENYGAAGSSCLGFEEITGVLSDDKRIIPHS